MEVKLASICGSDMHPYSGRGVLLDDGIIFGHEFVGVVVAAGSEVQPHYALPHVACQAQPALSHVDMYLVLLKRSWS